MENVFRLKAMTIMGQLSKVDGAKFSYRHELNHGRIMEVYYKKELYEFIPNRESFENMNRFLEEWQIRKPLWCCNTGRGTVKNHQRRIISWLVPGY